MKTAIRRKIDFTGGDEVAMGLAMCCMLHALAWPIVVTVLPSGLDSSSTTPHQALGAFTALFSAIVVSVGYDFHRDRWPLVLSLGGVLITISSLILLIGCCPMVTKRADIGTPFGEETLADWIAFLVVPAGAILLVSTHICNRKLLTTPRVKRKPR